MSSETSWVARLESHGARFGEQHREHCHSLRVSGVFHHVDSEEIEVIRRPEGPELEPALGFSEKNPPDCPRASGIPRRHVVKQNNNNNSSLRPTSPGVARTFFRFYVIYYSIYVNVTFSSTWRYRSGRETHRGSRLRTVPWPSLPNAVRTLLQFLEDWFGPFTDKFAVSKFV